MPAKICAKTSAAMFCIFHHFSVNNGPPVSPTLGPLAAAAPDKGERVLMFQLHRICIGIGMQALGQTHSLKITNNFASQKLVVISFHHGKPVRVYVALTPQSCIFCWFVRIIASSSYGASRERTALIALPRTTAVQGNGFCSSPKSSLVSMTAGFSQALLLLLRPLFLITLLLKLVNPGN